MKKRLLCTILIMVMMFGATVPSYAEAWTNYEATQVTNDVRDLRNWFYNFFTSRNVAGGNVIWTFNDLAENVNSILNWIKPSNATSTGLSIWDYLLLIATKVNDLWGGWDTQFSNLGALPSIDTHTSNIDTAQNLHNLSHTYFFENGITNPNGGAGKWVNLWGLTINGGVDSNSIYFRNTDAIGVIPAFLYMINCNTMQTGRILYNSFNQMHNGWFAKDYDAQLGIWDSQGETLTQEGWQATSVVNGLYKYLAYTQRDVARLTYVLASDEEIETREKARENQEAVLDNFVDPEGSGSVSASNFGDIASASDSFKDNMNTGVSASGIFDVFNGDHTSEWFSSETANELNNVGSGRRSLKASSPHPTYETPLLDAKMKELLSIFGGDGK